MAEPIRVLHVLGSLNAGGAESRTMDIYRNIDRSKIQFDFAIHTDEHCFFTDEVLSLGARIFTLPRFKGINYFEYKKAWEELFKKNKNLKIVHGHMTTTAFIYLKIAKQFGIKKRIAHARNSRKDNLIKLILSKKAKKSSTELFAVSKIAGISEFGKTNFKIVPNAFNYNKYKFSSNDRINTRKSLGLSKNSKLLVHVGRYHKQKNHSFILKIFSEIFEENTEYFLILIGNGNLKNRILKKTELKSCRERIFFVEDTKHVERYLSAGDIFLLPSLYEGLPGVLLEAQINGLPSIISSEITEESIITNIVSRLRLKDNWVNKIHEIADVRFKNQNTNIDEKYSIKNVIQIYEEIYLEKN